MGDFDEEFGIGLPEPVDAVPTSPYVHASRPPRTNFQPWHRPRKQYVREAQWGNQLRSLMSGRDPGSRIKYVGLPGVDLLDIRQFLTAVCEPDSRSLEFLGFDLAADSEGAAGTELNLSNAELKLHPLVHDSSLIRPDDVRRVGSRRSAAWNAVKKLGHVDVVNLDLTTHVLNEPPGVGLSFVDALKELLLLQVGNPNDWALLLTTRIDRASASPGAVDPLVDHLNLVVQSCSALAAEIEASLPGYCSKERDWRDAPSDFSVISLTAFMRWLHAVCMSEAVKSRPTLVSCFYYTSYESGDGSADMASLVIRFRRAFSDLPDAVFGEPTEGHAPPSDAACDAFVSYFKRFIDAQNIDALVSQDAMLKERLAKDTADMLEAARYDRPAFERWVASYAS